MKTGFGSARTFTARYTSDCGNCPAAIEPGDEAMYDLNDDVVHVDCPARAFEAPTAKVCADCHTEHAGECW